MLIMHVFCLLSDFYHHCSYCATYHEVPKGQEAAMILSFMHFLHSNQVHVLAAGLQQAQSLHVKVLE